LSGRSGDILCRGVEAITLRIGAGFGGVPVGGLDTECRTSIEMAQIGTNKYTPKSVQNERSKTCEIQVKQFNTSPDAIDTAIKVFSTYL